MEKKTRSLAVKVQLRVPDLEGREIANPDEFEGFRGRFGFV